MRQTMPRTAADRRAALWIAVLAAALLALFLASFVLGRYDVPIGQVVRILLSRVIPLTQTWTGDMEIAVLNLRLPRILLACLVGCSLSAAGTAYQSVFRNPMAAPDILVDGEFVLAQRNLDLRFRGSENQRILDVPQSLAQGRAVWCTAARWVGERQS